MHITHLRVTNFRAIRAIELADLKDLVVIAGPNGCGKSCIFDALRLLKSIYGGYQQNEYLQWFGEFQINVQAEQRDFSQLFRDRQQPVKISARMTLSESERTHLRVNGDRLAENLAWSGVLQQAADEGEQSSQALAMRYAHLVPQVTDAAKGIKVQILSALAEENYDLNLTIERPDSLIATSPSILANLVFRTYDPDNLGILDYHSATRNYAREGVGGVSLDLDSFKAQRKNLALYNWKSKYGNIKTEIISSYMGQLIKREAGASSDPEDDDSLDATLAEMFRLFFPDKTYLGVTPQLDGKLSFPVELSSGERHDLNELSSGEKEVLYGYLRLRNQTPRNSTILLDEPQLHLNPGLLRGFPQFYYRHLVQPTGNQIWMVTHSDTLLREAVGNENYSVYHMVAATGTDTVANQTSPLVQDRLQQALLDLVGDLAAYRPAARVIVFEGGGDSEFDVRVVTRLFPALRDRATLISGGGKGRVAELYRVLSETASQTGVSDRFYAVTDRDSGDQPDRERAGHVFTWDVYHIENYLLNPGYLYRLHQSTVPIPTFLSEADCLAALKVCAQSLVDRLVSIELRDRIDQRLNRCIKIAADPNSTSPVDDLLPSVRGTAPRWEKAIAEVTDETKLNEWESELRLSRTGELADGSWLQTFPGRDVLKLFVRNHFANTLSYDGAITSILTAMSADGYQPPGMKKVIDEILGMPARSSHE